MFYFSTNALHFSEEFFGIILLVDGVAQVLGKCILQEDCLAQCSPLCGVHVHFKSVDFCL